jgi:hypothetical protein
MTTVFETANATGADATVNTSANKTTSVMPTGEQPLFAGNMRLLLPS